MNRFENGFDSFKKAIKGLEIINTDEYALKEIIMNFHHSIEVLFKHILQSKEKYLIYKDIDNWVNNCFSGTEERKKSTTINFDETVKRVLVLFDYAEYIIDEYTYKKFNRLTNLRNSLTHDSIELSKEEVVQIFVSLITIVTTILCNNLPEEDREQFSKYVDSTEYNKILKGLIKENKKWRIVTIINILNLYKDKDFETVSNADRANIMQTLTALGAPIEYINDQCCVSPITYLKQVICRILLERCKEDELKEFSEILNNDTLLNILKECICDRSKYIYNIVGKEATLFDAAVVNDFLNDSTHKKQIEIYSKLYFIHYICDVICVISNISNKKRKDLLDSLFLDEGHTLPVGKMYALLIEWYDKYGWCNSINFEKLEDYERGLFFAEAKNNDIGRLELPNSILCKPSVYEDLYENIQYNESLHEILIGEMGEEGTIDRIDEVCIDGIEAVIKNDNMYKVVLNVLFGTETYYDHEYFPNGYESCYVVVEGTIEDKERFIINDIRNIGYAVEVDDFFPFD